MIERCCRALIAAEAALNALNALDARWGDGDTGSTLPRAACALIGALDRLPLAGLTQPYHAIGGDLSQTMGGSSGVLHAILCAAATRAAWAGADATARVSRAGAGRATYLAAERLLGHNDPGAEAARLFENLAR